jgi:transposase
MARERRLFSEEFKREAVKLVGQPGASKVAIARDPGIAANLLGQWCRDTNVDAEGTSVPEKVSPQEYERMRRELAKVKTERDILKGARLLRSQPQVKYGFIAKYRAIWPTRTMCRLLGVSSSGFYDWLVRPARAHERENAQLLKAIKHSHEASDGTYGSPRVVRDLIDARYRISTHQSAATLAPPQLNSSARNPAFCLAMYRAGTRGRSRHHICSMRPSVSSSSS